MELIAFWSELWELVLAIFFIALIAFVIIGIAIPYVVAKSKDKKKRKEEQREKDEREKNTFP